MYFRNLNGEIVNKENFKLNDDVQATTPEPKKDNRGNCFDMSTILLIIAFLIVCYLLWNFDKIFGKDE